MFLNSRAILRVCLILMIWVTCHVEATVPSSLLSWTNLAPAVAPSARDLAAMAFDQSTGQLILFEGYNTSGINLNDTWNWNGTNWV